MAASTEQKLDYLLKKIGFTASKTGLAEDSSLSGTKKAPFAESIPSPLVTPSTTIWNESALIPTTPPNSDTAQVRVYLTGTSGHRMTADSTVSGSRAFIAYSTFNNTSSEILGDWIDPQFGDSYIIKVYKGDPNDNGVLLSAAGTKDNSGNPKNDLWFFDYSSGVLNFNGTVIPDGVNDNNIFIVGYRYIGVKGLSIAGINTTGSSIFNNLNITGVSTFTNDINANGNIVGDDVTNISGINSVTATSFFGALTGNVTGTIQTAAQPNITSVGTLSSLSVSGDLDIDGHTELDNLNVSGVSTFTNNIQLKSDDGTPARIDLYCESSNAHYLRLQAPPHSSFSGNPTVTLPNIAGDVIVGDTASAIDQNINTTGIITASTLAGTLQTAAQPNITSLGTLSSLNVTGDVSIGGTLTYEDVTNIDSVGIVTARSGIKVLAGGINAVGIVTANGFSGALTGNVTGNADTATALKNARDIGGVSFDGTSDINLPGVNTAGNQNTSGTAAGLSGSPNINVSNIVGTALSISGISSITNQLDIKSDDSTPARIDLYCESNNAHYLRLQAPPHSSFSGNPTVTLPNTAGTLALTSSDITGNAGTATSLATARNIGGVSFDGTSDINLPGVNTTGNQNTSGTAAGLSGSPNINVSNIVGIALSISGIGTIGDTLKVGTGITASGGVITATTFDGSLATTNLTGTITNAQLAGSIANGKLSNSTVSYGGITVSLGGTDATPAFDLQDATNYPFTSLTGITTSILGDATPKLGGDLDGNSKNIFGVGIITATTFSGDVTGNAGTATSLATARTIGGVSFDGTSDINLPGVNQAGNQNTSGTAAGLSGSPNITVSNIVGTALTVSGNIELTGTVDGVDIAALNTTVAGKLSKTGGTMTGNINISNTAPQYVLSESDTTTSARSVVSVGQLFVQCGAAGSSNTTSAGIINLTGYNAIPAAQINLKSDLVTVTGVLTASSFFGDGSGLSNLPGGAGVSTSIGTFTANAGSPSNIDSFAYASNNYKVAEYTLHFTNGSNIQAQKLLVMQDGTNAFSNEYAIMFHSTQLVSVDAVISGSNVLVRATPESGISGITTFRWRREVQE